MQIYYIILGVLIALAFVYLFKISRSNPLSIGVWALAILTIIMGAFTLSWVFESLLEREAQAAGMGILIFGGVTILLFLGAKRLAKKPTKNITQGQNIQS